MNLHFEANKIKEICETKQGKEKIVELCKVVKEIHIKGMNVGFETALKQVDSITKNLLEMKSEHIS